ncbi:hypothetical protein PPACK8108_LOCUS3490 [Phakopsora pachyrhizi]|uniref:Uncharacterized protein n=1 Tax=Phakopsora pachyrhizi TaxID=170000 RepID=A0AAV0AM33_PHAPC|nr:hypothetical protein PPACK8108_LOCUS3027 [Phakopsora pachyrhizi]CAH7668917.1 hypothetical protein PPACK8108_LOCUS3490 [Phakopsora pachyrhizi]
MKITAWLSGNYLQSLFAHNNHFLTATNSVSPTNDQELFIDYNQRPFSEPQDFQFEPCPIWYNSEDFSLNATKPKILLQNQLEQACLKGKELEPTIDLENFLDTVE